MADTNTQPLFGNAAPSPQSLQYQRTLAQQLMQQGMSSEPIRSPWQGVGRIVQSMVGGYEGYQADQADQAARTQASGGLLDAAKSGDLPRIMGALNNPYVS